MGEWLRRGGARPGLSPGGRTGHGGADSFRHAVTAAFQWRCYTSISRTLARSADHRPDTVNIPSSRPPSMAVARQAAARGDALVLHHGPQKHALVELVHDHPLDFLPGRLRGREDVAPPRRPVRQGGRSTRSPEPACRRCPGAGPAGCGRRSAESAPVLPSRGCIRPATATRFRCSGGTVNAGEPQVPSASRPWRSIRPSTTSPTSRTSGSTPDPPTPKLAKVQLTQMTPPVSVTNPPSPRIPKGTFQKVPEGPLHNKNVRYFEALHNFY